MKLCHLPLDLGNIHETAHSLQPTPYPHTHTYAHILRSYTHTTTYTYTPPVWVFGELFRQVEQ